MAGIRRITAVCGLDAWRAGVRDRELLGELRAHLKLNPGEEARLLQRVDGLQQEIRTLRQELERARNRMASADVLSSPERIGSVGLVCARTDLGVPELRTLGDRVKTHADALVAILIGERDGKVMSVAAASPDAIAQGLAAGELLKTFAKATGGRGGGRPDMAQGGGGEPERLDEGFAAVRASLAALTGS